VKNLKMIKIHIKGRITDFTPSHAMRWLYSNEVLSKKIEVSDEMVVNNRHCKVAYIHYVGDTIIKKYCIYPIDLPLKRPNKLRKSELDADSAFFKFCRSGDWKELLWSWERSGRQLFRQRLLEHLNKKYPCIKDCDTCEHKFKCYTQK